MNYEYHLEIIDKFYYTTPGGPAAELAGLQGEPFFTGFVLQITPNDNRLPVTQLVFGGTELTKKPGSDEESYTNFKFENGMLAEEDGYLMNDFIKTYGDGRAGSEDRVIRRALDEIQWELTTGFLGITVDDEYGQKVYYPTTWFPILDEVPDIEAYQDLKAYLDDGGDTTDWLREVYSKENTEQSELQGNDLINVIREEFRENIPQEELTEEINTPSVEQQNLEETTQQTIQNADQNVDQVTNVEVQEASQQQTTESNETNTGTTERSARPKPSQDLGISEDDIYFTRSADQGIAMSRGRDRLRLNGLDPNDYELIMWKDQFEQDGTTRTTYTAFHVPKDANMDAVREYIGEDGFYEYARSQQYFSYEEDLVTLDAQNNLKKNTKEDKAKKKDKKKDKDGLSKKEERERRRYVRKTLRQRKRSNRDSIRDENKRLREEKKDAKKAEREAFNNMTDDEKELYRLQQKDEKKLNKVERDLKRRLEKDIKQRKRLRNRTARQNRRDRNQTLRLQERAANEARRQDEQILRDEQRAADDQAREILRNAERRNRELEREQNKRLRDERRKARRSNTQNPKTKGLKILKGKIISKYTGKPIEGKITYTVTPLVQVLVSSRVKQQPLNWDANPSFITPPPPQPKVMEVEVGKNGKFNIKFGASDYTVPSVVRISSEGHKTEDFPLIKKDGTKRLNAGTIELESSELNISKLIDEAMEEMSPANLKKKLKNKLPWPVSGTFDLNDAKQRAAFFEQAKSMLLTKCIGLLAAFGISMGIKILGKLNPFSDPNTKCPTDQKLDELIRKRNNMVSSLNDLLKVMQAATVALGIAQTFLALTKKSVPLIKNANIPLGAPVGVGVPSNVPVEMADSVREIKNKGVMHDEMISTLLIYITVFTALLSTIIGMLGIIDKAIYQCKDTAKLKDVNPDLLSALEEEQELGDYKDFKFEIEVENTTSEYKRRRALAIDKNNVVVLKSEWSYSSNTEVLINELKFYIDQNDLKAE